MTTQTQILQTVLTIVRDYGHKKAVAWLQGEEELNLADEDLTGFLSRRDIEDHDLTSKQWDTIRDVYLESVKTTMAGRVSSPVTVEVPFGKPGGPAATHENLDRVWPDVPPLGEIHHNGAGFTYIVLQSVNEMPWILEAQGDCVGLGPVTAMNYFYENHVHSIIAHLQAWLLTGSFSLTPPVSTQIDPGASLDTDRHSSHPSPEKPVVQPTGSDSDLLGEARKCLDFIADGQPAVNNGPYFWEDCVKAFRKAARAALSKLNA